ncbi:MAG: cation diffusion facilitator family transporter [Desulfobulbaceae bacterium]|nr:cation diffusion facilitator family transporter [Desulfobulbaceae bacterium]
MKTVPETNSRLLKRATYASVSVAAGLITAKLAAWLITGSLIVMASLVDSLMDAAASTINLIAVRWSLSPADQDHRFGHGKAEFLAGLAQASFIAGSAFFLVIHAIERLRSPVPIQAASLGIVVMAVSITLTLILLAYQHHVIRRTNSTAIRADALHYATDVLTNIGTIFALILASRGWPVLDPIFAIIIAGYIFYSACKIGYEAGQMLMDRELPSDIRGQILSIAQSPPQVKGVHDIRTRMSGQTLMIQLHLELDDDIPLIRAHGIARAVEKEILRSWPGADVIIHQDPVHLTNKTQRRIFTD